MAFLPLKSWLCACRIAGRLSCHAAAAAATMLLPPVIRPNKPEEAWLPVRPATVELLRRHGSVTVDVPPLP